MRGRYVICERRRRRITVAASTSVATPSIKPVRGCVTLETGPVCSPKLALGGAASLSSAGLRAV